MRIIAGLHKGRNFPSPPGNRTHPMGEKIRAAIFNMLGPIEGLSVLDAYAGSGSLAFEAISRGASRAVTVDIDKKAYKIIKESIEVLGFEDLVHATRANVVTWAKNVEQEFDIVFADPPYTDVNPLHLLALSERVAAGGLFVISHPDHYRPDMGQDFRMITQKSYANANITIFRKS